MIIVTKNQFIRCSSINHIILDELVENINVGMNSFALKKYLLTVVYTPENGNTNQHSSELRECTVALTSRKESYLLFKDMTRQIREQNPDQLYLNKLLENLLSDDDMKKIEDSELGENIQSEMKAAFYDPAQRKFVDLEKQKEKVKEYFENLRKAVDEVGKEIGLNPYFQDEEGTVYKIVEPEGRFVNYEKISYKRTRRIMEEEEILASKTLKLQDSQSPQRDENTPSQRIIDQESYG